MSAIAEPPRRQNFQSQSYYSRELPLNPSSTPQINTDSSTEGLDNANSESAAKIEMHSPELGVIETKSEAASDKPIVEKTDSVNKNPIESAWGRVLMNSIDSIEMKSCYTAIAANLIGALLQISKLQDGTKEFLSKLVNFITNFSFMPYSISGAKNGYLKKNPFQTFGFILEGISVWISNLQNKYLIRGPATGTDQIWVAVDPNLPEIKDGKFNTWSEGFSKTLSTSWKLLKEICKDPIKTLCTIDMTHGHHALLSSFLDIVSGVGYGLTGNEKIFGSCRDLASWLFDVAMVFSKNMKQKAAGILFIIESLFDFGARFTKTKFSRLCVNQLAHAAGRIALTLYKNSDSVANSSSTKPEAELVPSMLEPEIKQKQESRTNPNQKLVAA